MNDLQEMTYERVRDLEEHLNTENLDLTLLENRREFYSSISQIDSVHLKAYHALNSQSPELARLVGEAYILIGRRDARHFNLGEKVDKMVRAADYETATEFREQRDAVSRKLQELKPAASAVLEAATTTIMNLD